MSDCSASEMRVVLSVIIVNRNTQRLLRDCLKSLHTGISRYPFEIFVVDNASADGSPQMVRSEFPHVRLLENQQNRGFAAANNQALRLANGAFFLLLNSDTVLTGGSIDRLIHHMQEHPRCGFCGPQLLNADGSLQNSVAAYPSLATELLPKWLLRLGGLLPTKAKLAEQAQTVDTLVGACLLARRAMTDQIGFYDEDYFFFFEETDWCLRARDAGWSCDLVPHARIFHLQGQTARQTPIPVRIEYWRSRYAYFRRHSSFFASLLLRTGLLFRAVLDLILNLPLAPFSGRSRHKARLYATILLWHLRGRPARMGISCPSS